jgi:hypothetical protein
MYSVFDVAVSKLLPKWLHGTFTQVTDQLKDAFTTCLNQRNPGELELLYYCAFLDTCTGYLRHPFHKERL